MTGEAGNVPDRANMAAKTTYNIPPPSYKNASSYDHYKTLLSAWAEYTDVPKAKQGLAVALSLEGSENMLCEKLFSTVKIDDLKVDGGLELVKTFLDKECGKDALEECLSTFEDFDDYRKSSQESYNMYISNFDQKVCKMKKSGVVLPSPVLAFTLLRRAGLSHEEKLLILSGVDYAEKDTLYEQTQKSMKKFKGEGSSYGGSSSNSFSQPSQPVIKTEPTFYTRGGYGYQGNNNRYQQSSGRGILRSNPRGQIPFRQNTGGLFRNYGRNEGPNSAGNWRGRGASVIPGKSNFTHAGEKPVNPMGENGRPLRCTSCDSFRHFVRDCPHAWEKNVPPKRVHYTQDNFSAMPNENYSPENLNYDENQYPMVDPYVYENPLEQLGAMGNFEGDISAGMGALRFDDNSQYYPQQFHNEHVFHIAVLYTGGDELESRLLQNEADQSCILDSACTSTVCGYNWYQSYVDSLSLSDVDLIKSRKGEKTFKFGIGLAESILECDIPVYIGDRRIMLRTDVVKADVPLLLSISTMASLGMVIDLGNDVVKVFGKSAQLNRTSSGHLSLPISNPSQNIERAFVVSLENVGPDVLKKRLKHIHKQFGHPTQEKLTSLLKDCVKWKPEYGLALDEIYKDCDRCKEFARTPSRPVVAIPMARTFNEKVCMDLKSWNDRWILHLVDMFSRYTISAFVPRKDSTSILCAIIDNWISYFGIMQGIFSDNGGEFRNDELREVGSVLNFSIQTTAADSPFQNGLCEKNHAIVDLILSKLKADYPHIKVETLLRWANMAKNSLQMWCGFSSNQLVFGFNPRLPSIMCDPLPSMNETTLSETLCNTLNIIHDARKAFIQSEAENKIKIALRNRIRSSEAVYVKDDWVFYKRDGKQQWLGPARVIFQDRKVVLIDHGGFYIKVSPNRLTKVSSQFASNGEVKQAVDSVIEEGEGMFRMDVVAEDDIQDSNQPIQDKLPENEDTQKRAEDSYPQNNVQSDDDSQEDDFSGFSQDQIKKAAKEFQAKYRESMNSGVNVDSNARRSERNKDTDQVYMVDLQKSDGFPLYPVYITTIPRNSQNNPECEAAKEVELQKLKDFDVYDEVIFQGQECVSTRWVLWHKGSEVRARLVARGFEEVAGIEKESPTVGKVSVRLFFAICGSKMWTVKTTDIKSAFLQGNPIDREICIKPPKEAKVEIGKVWKLKRCLYGLNDAARKFYDSVVMELKNLGCLQSMSDPALFYYKKDGNLCGILVSHIDDFLHAGNNTFEEDIMQKLRCRFVAGKLMENDFSYVGFQVKQTDDGVIIDQSQYINDMKVPVVSVNRISQKDDELTPIEYTTFRSVVGSMNWVGHGTRPDILYDLIELSMHFNQATVADLLRAVKIARKLKEADSTIFFPALSGNPSEWKLVVFTDAALGNLPDGFSSTAARLVFLVDGDSRGCILAFKSNKIARVVRSTLAAEVLSLQEGLEEALYLQDMVKELLHTDVKIHAYIDNKSTIDSVNSTKMVKDKRLFRDIAAIKQELNEQIVESLAWVPDKDQLANCLTKKGASNVSLLAVLHTGILPKLPEC